MRLLTPLTPRSIYGRFLLIIVIPVLIVQLVSIYVFYYTHLDVITKHMARSVVSEMSFITKSFYKTGYKNLIDDFSSSVGLEFSFEVKRKLKKKKIADSNWSKSRFYKYINPLIDPYNRFKSELENHHLTPYEIFQDRDNDDFIIVKLQTRHGIVSFDVPIKRITSSSSHVFTFWMVLTALVTSLISILFLRNQIRSIKTLSSVAEKFGRGQNVLNFKPKGSQEIRLLGISFIKMKERIFRQISQRTEMLSAVSHDLRTPLTRMKLQLEMMGEGTEGVEDLKQDVSDMEKLVDEYLNFVRFDDKEKSHAVKIKHFIEQGIIKYYAKMNKDIKSIITFSDDIEVSIKKLALKRALFNLIDNAFNYGKSVELHAMVSNKNLIISIDDDGPGIPAEERNKVFKPFYRIDNSRNLDRKIVSGGSGLGLAIALDAVTSHGGHIKLGDSALGGLSVKIFIPV